MDKILNKVNFCLEPVESTNDFVKYRVNIKIPLSIGWIDEVRFVLEGNNSYKIFHKYNDDEFAVFETDVIILTKALYHYYFTIQRGNDFIYYKKEQRSNTKAISWNDMWKLSVNFECPQWAKGKIMYHIFLDRFYRDTCINMKPMKNRIVHKNWDEEMVIGPDSNGKWNIDFYGGNLRGIIDKLEYIKSLGVSILYISPIVWSQSNHRYDASDYSRVDPYAGTNKDLKDLCDKAHSLGMKVILDAVFNHTGNDSVYFNEYGNFSSLGAYQSKDSKYYSFYKNYVENNQTFFDYWWGMKNLPVCDGNSHEWQQFIYGEGGIIDLWFDLGIDGLRLDVADELSDDFIENIHKAVVRNKKDGFILGEVWKNPMRMNRSYVESGRGMHSVMNYLLVDALIRYFKYGDVFRLKDVFQQLKTEYPDDTLKTLMNFTSTHDITRAINIFSTDEFQKNGEWAWDLNNNDLDWQKNYEIPNWKYNSGKELYKSYVYTLAFLPGILSIFYGDEIGMQGMGNLSNRKPFDWECQDKDLLDFFKHIGFIRREESFLEDADINILDINEWYMMFERIDKDDKMLVIINRTGGEIPINIPDSYHDAIIMYKLKDSYKEKLDSHGALVLKKKNI